MTGDDDDIDTPPIGGINVDDDDAPAEADADAEQPRAAAGGQTVLGVLEGGRKVVDIDAERRRMAAPDGASPLNFDVDVINDSYAVVVAGAGVVIMQEAWKLSDPGKAWFDNDVPLQDQVRVMTLKAFETWLQNDRYEIDRRGTQKSAAQLWIVHPDRRQYAGMTFDPRRTPHRYYNLFQGFPFEWVTAPAADYSGMRWNPGPSPKIGSCDLFLDHVRANICNGSEDLFVRVMGWAAQIVQRPAERLGVALALRGGKGTGKTLFGEVIGKLLGPYWVLVDHPRYITGQFNAHLQSLLLLQADEGFWAGKKEDEGVLKGLITSREHMIERKNVDPVRMPNFVRLLVTSNEDWVVPASFDERRWMVLDVADHAKQNREYFGALMAQLAADSGSGYAALMKYLLEFDLETANLGEIPQTDALVDQKLRSLPPELEWWHTCLWQGWIIGGEWKSQIDKADVYGAYIKWCDAKKINHRLGHPEFTRKVLNKYVPGGIKIVRPTGDDGSRRRCYEFPPLATLRETFDEEVGGGVPWLGEDGKLVSAEAEIIDDI